MSTIQLNGSAHPYVAGTTVAELVSAMTGRALLASGQAADGGRLGQWAATPLELNDELEIVTAVQGG